MPKFQAVRVTKGSKKVVHVIDEAGQVVAKAGGARAERAQAVVISYFRSDQRLPDVELRADPAQASALAASYLRTKLLGYRDGEPVFASAAVFATSVLIEEAV